MLHTKDQIYVPYSFRG